MGAMTKIFALAAMLAVANATAHVKKYKFGQDTDWPPYAFKDENDTLQGIGKDVADGMTALCDDLEIEVVKVAWNDCWTSDDKLGASLEDGTVDACMTYTHARGARDTLADWSMAFLKVDKAAGLITKLDADGKPMVKGDDTLAGKKVADVGGWAPTADTIEFVKNGCTGEAFEQTKDSMVVIAQAAGENVNDKSLKSVLDGTNHALYLYGDSAETFKCKGDDSDATAEHDCKLWSDNLGKPNGYAYFQTGQFGWTINGTTLAMTKPGSPAAQAINQCMYKFMQTKEFYDVCVKHGLECDCVPNDHFVSGKCKIPAYNQAPSAHGMQCSDGYCPCPTAPSPPPATTTASTGGEVSHGTHRYSVGALSGFALLLMSMTTYM